MEWSKERVYEEYQSRNALPLETVFVVRSPAGFVRLYRLWAGKPSAE
jgi:hypothetical protein